VIPAVLPTYARADVAFERGEGCHLYGTDGRRYLDLTSGIAVVGLGHSHPHLVKEIQAQAARLMHCSNLFVIPGQERLAQRLADATFAATMFFSNSGAEANECAIKMARRYHYVTGHPERYRIVTFDQAFHGRTLATIAATGQEKVLNGFGPKVDGFDQVPFGDLAALKAAIGEQTAAVMIEPIQGEGGVRAAPEGFLEEVRALCDARGLLLIMDEIQCGMGRTGRLLAHEWTGAKPDIATLGKGIGNGFPLGACLATEQAAQGMTAGTHGSTYGGNPLAAAAGNAVLDVMLEPGFLPNVVKRGEKFRARVKRAMERNDSIFEDVRGRGLLLGVKCRKPNGDVVTALRKRGVLTVAAGDNVVRLLPPLVVGDAEIEEAGEALDAVSRDLAA
jgi:acetylornithine/N-succinyldiaminopimelate aminotransferase